MKDSKHIEFYVTQLLLGMPETSLVDDGKYTRAAIKIFGEMKEIIPNKYGKPFKPKVVDKPIYSTKSEPKTDIITSDVSDSYFTELTAADQEL